MLHVHDRCLPEWLHRLASGVLVGVVSATLGILGLDTLGDRPGFGRVFTGALYSSPPVGIAAALLAHRFSAVRGVAGGEGHDELR